MTAETSLPPPAATVGTKLASIWRHFGLLRFILRWLARFALAVGVLWSAAAWYYTDLAPGVPPRALAATLVIIGALALAWFLRPAWLAMVAIAGLVVLTIAWFLARQPGADKHWTPDVAQAPWASIDGDRLTLHNVRHFSYGLSESDATPRWETRTYDLSKLNRVDYVLSYWAGEWIAHAMVSFGFEDGQRLAVSIETRKEEGETYSAVQGFFRQYELVYVFADERDVIGVRTNVRGERVYVHPLRTSPVRARQVLLDYVAHANELKQNPSFYNALTENCATGVIRHFSTDKWKPSPWTLSLLLPGYSGRWAYDMRATDRSLPWEQYRERCNVVENARAAGLENPEFSRLIRVGVPDPNSMTRP